MILNPTMDSIQRVADVLQIPIFELFFISTRNDKLSDKSEITCPCCCRKLKIDVKNPKETLYIEIREEATYIYLKKKT